MKYIYKNNEYEIIIEKKKIKNTYIRVKEDLKIHITTNIFSNTIFINKLIKDNTKAIDKMIERQLKLKEKDSKFIYLGKEYNVVICKEFTVPKIDENYIFVKDEDSLKKFLNKEAKSFLPNRLYEVYKRMNDNEIPMPHVKVRKMVRKWGYCNKLEKIVCLNKELIKCNIDDIDYVIVHELCHFLHFDHSKEFWKSVEKYKPDYKINKKNLKEN